MAKRRLCVRRIKEILRLRHELGKSYREIGEICRIGKTTAQEYLLRANAARLRWPLPAEMTEDDLERLLFSNRLDISRTEPANSAAGGNSGAERSPIPFQYIFEELKRPNVTLALLWEEYKQENPDGYQYSWFSEQVKKYRASVNYSMRQEHKAGEKTFVDFGSGICIVDRNTGALIPTQLFVSVWGASKYTYAEAVLKEDTASWVKVNNNAFWYFKCCSQAVVPDNPKTVVTKACRYEPWISRTFEEFARHYGTVIMPARAVRPKDKALAENGVKLGKRWILARLRNRIFHSIEELNAAIWVILADFNSRKMKRFGKSRNELFETLDKPQALPLPDKPYEYAEWKKAKVNINYHICFEKHDYSVPYTFIHREVEIKATSDIVEVYYKGQRLCSHRRSYVANGYSTVKEHMPPSHQRYIEWTPERIMEWAGKSGSAVKTMAERIISSRKFPEQAYKSCLGLIRLANHYPEQKLNAACERALKYNIYSYTGVKNILKNGLEEEKEPEAVTKAPLHHENLRGAEYFTTGIPTSPIKDTADLFSQSPEEAKCPA